MNYPVLLAAVFLVSAPAAFAQTDPDSAEQESQWTPPEAAPSKTPGVPSAATTEGDYATPDRRRMDEERRKDHLDQYRVLARDGAAPGGSRSR